MTEHYPLPNEGERLTIHQAYLVRGAVAGIRVPLWVPCDLIAEFVDCATEYGTDHATDHVKKIMKDAGND